ncbi:MULTISPECIES: LPS translocon maturation chaperone LptM [Francisella]|uniref:Lipoprotein n=1 Tax=Francisella opportunistica TaxID=2016517 RepID=A0A345JSU7_9GAMM|nr:MULTISPECIES: lipoprotein [Francisella]APC92172.1 hypothetical protein BBG19_1444 [Francisella sp. MA067296]AXH30393.1 hypothetical protein CGC43_07270 [Francisella opportunistica]AXH32033.1 hypothetical protein CGC44_07245 [Francisella opportunistica]AXH33681.1 hypothetical protein CGC45_07275 [Francisella opportunistica]
MKKQLFVISITAAILVLSACGQTGPLYLPKEKNITSGSTIAKSGSSMMNQNQQSSAASANNNQSDTTTKVDNDPTPPAHNNNPSPSELFEGNNNFSYNNNIQNSQNAGGTPTL